MSILDCPNTNLLQSCRGHEADIHAKPPSDSQIVANNVIAESVDCLTVCYFTIVMTSGPRQGARPMRES